MGIFGKDLFHKLLYLGYSRRTTYQHDFIDICWLQFGILQRLQDRAPAPFDERINQLLEFGPCNVQLQVLRTGSICRDERQVDISRGRTTKFFFGFFTRFLQPLQCHGVLSQINALFLFEFISDVVNENVVQIVATQMRVAAGANHLEHFDVVFLSFGFSYLENGDIESPTA